VLLGGFPCFSKGGKIRKTSLFEWFAPCKWQDLFCILTNYITLWITASQEYRFASNTSSAGISQFASIPVATRTSHLLQESNNIVLLSKQRCTCRENKAPLSHRFEIKNHKWQTLIQMTQHHPAEGTVITHFCHSPSYWACYTLRKVSLPHSTTLLHHSSWWV